MNWRDGAIQAKRLTLLAKDDFFVIGSTSNNNESNGAAMNGAESLVRTLVAGKVDVCFTNPGTSEMHFVSALDRVDGMRCVLGLFEGVVTGAADGYYRMKGTPASTLLHLGPGLGNGIANLHNAKKASSGIVNIVGQHATYHIDFNAPLTSDIEGLARPVSSWVRTSPDAKSVARDGAAAIAAASASPGQIATLILPADTAWNDADGIAEVGAISQRAAMSASAVDNAAKILKSGEPTLILMSHRALREDGLALAQQIAGKTGCKVMAQGSNPRVARGAGRYSVDRVPYVVDLALNTLKDFRHIILVEAHEPVAFFAYPNKPSLLKADGADSPQAVRHRRRLHRQPAGAGRRGRRQARRRQAADARRDRQADRSADACVDRRCNRRGDPGERHRRRRGGDHRPRILRAHRRR